MDFLAEVVSWFGDPARWSGRSGVPNRVVEHLWLSVSPMVVAATLALPPAALLGHVRRGGFLAVAVVNVGRAVPSFGILILFVPISLRAGLGLGFWPTFMALLLLAMPPIFVNTYTGVAGVDRATVEAARGMGMRPSQVLLRVELPIAMPVVVTGLRVSAVQVVATATLGAVVGAGGLGRYIIDGFSQRDNVQVFAGGLLVALLALGTDLGFTALSRVLPGARARARAAAGVARPGPRDAAAELGSAA